MGAHIDRILENEFAAAVANFSVAALALVIFLVVFEIVTSYSALEEIRKGNAAVGLAVAGKIFGICNVFRFAISSGDTVYDALLWASFGFVMLLLAYFIFEFLTPFKVDKQLAEGNIAVGVIALMISVALSYVIGASVA